MRRQQTRQRRTNKGKPKENNRHAYGNGNGKFGKKQDRIQRMEERKGAKTIIHYA